MLFTSDQAAIVTGGSQGIGYAITAEMINSGLGKAVIASRDQDKGEKAAQALTELGAEVVFVAADLGEPDGPGRVADVAESRFGSIHALVNGAAVTDRDSVYEPDLELFDRVMAVNVRAPLELSHRVVANMKAHGVEGSIVNIGSVASHAGPPFLASYSSSKGALTALTKNLANALKWDRIRVNIVNPGWMNTPGEDAIQKRFHGRGDGWLEDVVDSQPFGRLIEPEEIARLVAFLASPSSGMITGAVIDYDQAIIGGRDPDPNYTP